MMRSRQPSGAILVFLSSLLVLGAFTSCEDPLLAPHTVTYDGNGNTGGTVPTDDGEYIVGQELTVLGNPGNLSETGSYFGGWNTQADGSGPTYTEGQALTMGTSDVTLYAKWTSTYTVTYDANGAGSGSVPTDSTIYTSGQTVTVLGNTGGLATAGYNFEYWNTKSDGSGASYKAGDTFTIGYESPVLYAVLKEVYSIGDTGPAGGIVFYDKGSYSEGWRYVSAAPSDQNSGIMWYNYSLIATGATATAVGAGRANTYTIVDAQGSGSYAASVCRNLILGGHQDWFLPSKNELDEMYNERATIGGFASAPYWTSTEVDANLAYLRNFSTGASNTVSKNISSAHVRAVRYF